MKPNPQWILISPPERGCNMNKGWSLSVHETLGRQVGLKSVATCRTVNKHIVWTVCRDISGAVVWCDSSHKCQESAVYTWRGCITSAPHMQLSSLPFWMQPDSVKRIECLGIYKSIVFFQRVEKLWFFSVRFSRTQAKARAEKPNLLKWG